jgi:SpoVK/Ycf46/Vps4 family AAA+-type ATPase
LSENQTQQQLEETTNTNNNNNNNNNNDDQINQAIKEEKQKEISYIMEASQIDDKRSKYLAKKNEYKVLFEDGKVKTFKRKPLSVRKNKEIDDLRSTFLANMRDLESRGQKITVAGSEFDNVNDVLFEAFKRTASYCLDINGEEYDNAIWEDDPDYMKKDVYGLRSVLAACLLRAVHGVAYFPQP